MTAGNFGKAPALLLLLALVWTYVCVSPASAGLFDFLFGGAGDIVGANPGGTLGTIELTAGTPASVDAYGRFNGFTSGTINGANLTFDLDDANIKLNLRGADSTWTKTGSGNYVKYSSSNIDIEYYVYNGYIKQNVTLKKKPYPSLDIELTNKTGWLWQNDPDGNVTLYDDLERPVMTFSVPYVIDGKGNRIYPGIRVDSNNRVFFVNGSDLISASAPVLLDPLIQIYGSGRSDSLSYVSQRHMTRASDGTLWAIWMSSTTEALYAYSHDDGKTWTTGTLDTLSTLATGMSITSDSRNYTYAFIYGKEDGLETYNNIWMWWVNSTSPGGWQGPYRVTADNQIHRYPAACVNSSDYLYLMFNSYEGGAYTGIDGIHWGYLPPLTSPNATADFVNKGEITAYEKSSAQSMPTCVIDKDDTIYTSWYGLAWSPYSSYMSRMFGFRTLSNNTWEPPEQEYNPNNYHQYEGSSMVNSSGYYIDTWRGKGFGLYPNQYAIYYRVRSPGIGGTWNTMIRLDKAENYADSTPSVMRDRGDNITVHWMGTGYGTYTTAYNILYRTYTVGWNNWTDTTYSVGEKGISSRNDYEPHDQWEYWPKCQKTPRIGYQIIYVNQTGASSYAIMYFNSSLIAPEGYWGSCVVPIDAAFSCTPTTGTINYDTTCTDLTNTSTPTSWSWEVWNSTGIKLTSSVKNPIFNLTFADQYGVNLTVSDGVTTDSQNTTGYLIAKNSVAATFNVTPSWGNQTQKMQFVGNGTAINQSYWDWDLDDGNTTTHTQNISDKQYPCDSGAPGWVGSGMCQYDPTYKIYDSYGTPWVNTHQVDFWLQQYGYNVTVYQNATPTVTFVANVTSGGQPLPVKFTPTVVDAIKVDSWSWDLGDSNTSTLQSPENVYWEGTYSISVTATNYTLGVTTVTRTNYITVTAGAAPIVTFTCTPRATIPNGSIACTYTGDAATTYDWYSTTSGGQQALFSGNVTTQNPTFFPKKPGGYFSIDLIACNGALCNSTVSGPRYIWVQKYPQTWWGGW